MKIKKGFAIKLIDVSKKYILHHEKPTLVENIFRFRRKEEIWALKDINLEIKKGEKIGIIGDNGSGKTTLLKIITGITSPTKGELGVNGRVAALIDLEAGFHPELTGEENIYLNGMLLGMSKEEIKQKFTDIVKFSGLEKFIDTPFHTYSSGMRLRLGFSVAAHSNPNILLMDDEAIFLGDRKFQNKIQDKIKDFYKLGKTVIIVSHWLEYLEKNSEKVILMKDGEIKKIGIPKSTISYYKNTRFSKKIQYY